VPAKISVAQGADIRAQDLISQSVASRNVEFGQVLDQRTVDALGYGQRRETRSDRSDIKQVEQFGLIRGQQRPDSLRQLPPRGLGVQPVAATFQPHTGLSKVSK
jgi:hypothetical protein